MTDWAELGRQERKRAEAAKSPELKWLECIDRYRVTRRLGTWIEVSGPEVEMARKMHEAGFVVLWKVKKTHLVQRTDRPAHEYRATTPDAGGGSRG